MLKEAGIKWSNSDPNSIARKRCVHPYNLSCMTSYVSFLAMLSAQFLHNLVVCCC